MTGIFIDEIGIYCDDDQVAVLLGQEALESADKLLEKINEFNATAPKHMQLQYLANYWPSTGKLGYVKVRADTLPQSVKDHIDRVLGDNVVNIDDYR